MARKKKQQSPAPTVSPETISSRYRFFLWMCGFFAVAALFMRLDVMTVWPGAEAYSLELALSNERASFLPAYLHSLLVEPGAKMFAGADLFYLFPRLLSAVVLIVAMILYYRWGKLLFGVRTVQLQLLLVAASLWLPFFGKVATADALLLLAHIGLWLSMIFVVRSGLLKYQLYLGAFALLGGIIAPVSTLVFALVVCLFFLRQSNFGSVVQRAWPGLFLPLVGFLSFPDTEWTYFGFSTVQWGYALLGTLPFIGFVFGGLRDMVFKVRKGEELARIYLGLVVAGLLSGSPLFAFALCLLAGKQLQLYFTKGYPWNNWVRGPSILHLIFALIGSFLLLLGGFITFRGDGYRAFLGMVAAYWIFSLFGVLGIYGMRRDFTIGGVVLSGLLATLFFWVQVYPYFETERNWPVEFIETLEDTDYRSVSPVLSRGGKLGFEPTQKENTSNLRPYLQRAGIPYTNDLETTDLLIAAFPADTTERQLLVDIEGRSWLRLFHYGLSAAD